MPPRQRTTRLEAGRIARRRARQQRRRAALLLLMVAAGLLVAVDLLRDSEVREGAPARSAVQSGPTPSGPAPQTQPAASPTATPSAPDSGPGTFTYSSGTGAVLGTAGTLRRFRVAVEDGVGADPDEFAAAVDAILGDPRSWIAVGSVRFQRVPQAAAAEFTIFLATPTTSEKMCREDGLHTEKYTSCRLASGKVVINLARWLTSVPDYGAPLDVYRAYALNHEVGHQLGRGHEGCPGAGKPAPVMQQQTLGLKGCVAYAWPYRDGVRYAGPAIP